MNISITNNSAVFELIALYEGTAVVKSGDGKFHLVGNLKINPDLSCTWDQKEDCGSNYLVMYDFMRKPHDDLELTYFTQDAITWLSYHFGEDAADHEDDTELMMIHSAGYAFTRQDMVALASKMLDDYDPETPDQERWEKYIDDYTREHSDALSKRYQDECSKRA